MKFSPFILLCTTGLFAIFSSTISKSPVLPLFATYLGANPSEVGIIASVSSFTGIIASIPSGILSDRFGRKRMLILSAVVFATAPFLYLLVTNIWQLALIRFYHGLATAIFIPVSIALVSDLFHKERGKKIGWFSTSTLLGRFMAPVMGGSIIGILVFNPGLGYKAVYVLCGIAGVIVLLLALRMPNPSKFIISPTPSLEKRAVEGWEEVFKSFRSVISKRAILITATVEAAMLFAYGTFETFLPLYSIGIGLSAYEIGIFLSAQVITLALTKPMMGRFSDRHGRKPQIFAGAIIGAVCIGSFSLFRSFIPLLALSILFGLSLSIVTSATAAFIADLSGPETRGSAMGVLGSIMDIGHTTGPIVSGILVAYFGFATAFLGASLVLLASAVVLLIGVSKSALVEKKTTS
ncbi:MAG TPA: MFS transporter [Nitrospiraceae bacterium]|nr:MFS transporter [Nitrospiraceae bacterium]